MAKDAVQRQVSGARQRHLSVNQVKTYLICPLKYFYRYVRIVGNYHATVAPTVGGCE